MDPVNATEHEVRGRRPRGLNSDLWGSRQQQGRSSFSNLLPTRISGSLTQEQMSAYQTMFRIQEITSELRSNEMRPPQRRNRSPSPPPAYDTRGKRINTREQRYRRKLEEERHRLVEIVLKMIPHFVAPEDYKRPVKFQDKYYIPVEQYPGINFVGLLLGPRGNTLKKLQEDSGCKIAIRGRGSVKEGKNAHDLPKGAMNFSDPLHCLIIADTEEKIQKGIKVCENIVVRAVTSPEGQNDLKRGQLRELAELNGTLREDKRPCNTCGVLGHKNYECPDVENAVKKVQCRNCGQFGHPANDCIDNGHPLGAARQESGHSRYNAASHSNWPERNRERVYKNGYNANAGGVSSNATNSYRSRFSRELHEQPPQAYSQSNVDYGIPSSGQPIQHELPCSLPPPGMDSEMSQPLGWNVPGMTSLAQNPSGTFSNPPLVDALPPGLTLPTSGIPGITTTSITPVLGGPPGLSEDQKNLGPPQGLPGPPGL